MADKNPPSQTPKRIFIVDDHPVVRQGIAMLVNQESDLKVCGDAEGAAVALREIERIKPDLVILDLSLKDGNGLELIKDLRIRLPKLLILVLSMHDESFYAERVLRAGAKGYITKDEATGKVVEGIRRILRGEVFLSDRMATKMLSKLTGGRAEAARPSVENLTDRELQVFELIGSGIGTSEIAKKLHLSVKTIDSHREHIKQKLKLDSASELVKHAVQWVHLKK
ncbi:MAG: response regulator transcription factor [Phycisphaerae bacterium]|jgi:DNA-binding NarL/FixJ family response regulator